jgi:SulP family sulfate permease
MSHRPVRSRAYLLSLWQGLNGRNKAQELFSSLMAGLLIGLTEILAALSFGSLIFSGELAPYLPYGLGMALAGAAALMIGTSLISRMSGVIPSAQDSPAVLLAVMAAGLAGSLAGAQPEVRLITVLVAIAVTSLLTGFFFLALGFFKLGALVRYVPYPVVGGFLAGTGWLLVQGSFGVVAGYPLTLANLPLLLTPDRVLVWAAALLFALGLFLGLRRFRHLLTLPAILLGAIGLFYLALLASGTSLEAAAAKGILLARASGGAAWEPLTLRNALAANWTAILGQGGHMATVLVLSVVSLLLNASALELATRRDADLNHELKAAGIGNLLVWPGRWHGRLPRPEPLSAQLPDGGTGQVARPGSRCRLRVGARRRVRPVRLRSHSGLGWPADVPGPRFPL